MAKKDIRKEESDMKKGSPRGGHGLQGLDHAREPIMGKVADERHGHSKVEKKSGSKDCAHWPRGK